MIDFKGSQFEREIILWGVRWYVVYPISYRQLEEMMGEEAIKLSGIMQRAQVPLPEILDTSGGRRSLIRG
jgi:hypothetical protein